MTELGNFAGNENFFFHLSVLHDFFSDLELVEELLTSKSRTWIAFPPMAFVARFFFSSSC